MLQTECRLSRRQKEGRKARDKRACAPWPCLGDSHVVRRGELELGEDIKEGRWVVAERHEKAPVDGVLQTRLRCMLVVRTESGHLKPIPNAEIDHVRLIYPNDVMVETARVRSSSASAVGPHKSPNCHPCAGTHSGL